jgi:hypothetical protein
MGRNVVLPTRPYNSNQRASTAHQDNVDVSPQQALTLTSTPNTVLLTIVSSFLATNDVDSALSDDDLCTPCSSLRHSIYHYNGRRFHAFRDGQYLIPNDEAEQDRLELLHLGFKLILDGNQSDYNHGDL